MPLVEVDGITPKVELSCCFLFCWHSGYCLDLNPQPQRLHSESPRQVIAKASRHTEANLNLNELNKDVSALVAKNMSSNSCIFHIFSCLLTFDLPSSV